MTVDNIVLIYGKNTLWKSIETELTHSHIYTRISTHKTTVSYIYKQDGSYVSHAILTGKHYLMKIEWTLGNNSYILIATCDLFKIKS